MSDNSANLLVLSGNRLGFLALTALKEIPQRIDNIPSPTELLWREAVKYIAQATGEEAKSVKQRILGLASKFQTEAEYAINLHGSLCTLKNTGQEPSDEFRLILGERLNKAYAFAIRELGIESAFVDEYVKKEHKTRCGRCVAA